MNVKYESVMHAMAVHLSRFFDGEGAVDFVEQNFDCNEDPSKSFVITMQKVDGLTPKQKLDEANKTIEKLRKELSEK